MEEGSYTLLDQENPSQPLSGRLSIKDEIEESEVTIATLKGEILGEEQRIRFYLYGILAAFYALVKEHTDKSYKVALRVCAFGFFLMLVGLAVGFTNISSPPIGSYIAIASGVITEIIAGVFFSAYNRNSRHIKGYYDSLLTVQNILLSFKFIENTQDENEKAKTVGQMLAYFMNKQSLYSSDGNEHASHRPATINHKRI